MGTNIKRVVMSISIPVVCRDKLKILAEKNNMTMSAYICQLIKDAYDKQGSK